MNALTLFALWGGMLLLGGLAGCGQSGATNAEETAAEVSLPDTLALAYQDTVRLPPQGDWLTFDRLVTDSRCPTGATCVWEGNAEVGFTLSQEGRRHVFTLNSHPSFTTDSLFARLKIELLDLTPYPHVDSSYGAGRFTVHLYLAR